MYLGHVVDNMKNVFVACVAGGFFWCVFCFCGWGKVRVSGIRKLNRGKKTIGEWGRGEGSEPCPLTPPLFCFYLGSAVPRL